MSEGSSLNVSDTEFNSGQARLGGAILILGGSSLVIENSVFFENLAFETGGAINGDDLNSITIRETTFTQNSANIMGDDL
jgi:predicted outer membrane repeat protein